MYRLKRPPSSILKDESLLENLLDVLIQGFVLLTEGRINIIPWRDPKYDVLKVQ